MEKNLEKIFGFLGKVENLKSTLRYLHTKSGRRESTAEHSWRLALMSFVVAPELGLKLDVTKATQMAIVHDLAEAVTGDIDAIKIAENKITHDEKINWK